MDSKRTMAGNYEVPARSNPNSITFYDSDGNCIHMKKEFALASHEGDKYAVSYNGAHLFDVDAECADSFVHRYSQEAEIIEGGIRKGALGADKLIISRELLRDFSEWVLPNLRPSQSDPTRAQEKIPSFHFGTEAAGIQKYGKTHYLHFGPTDTVQVLLRGQKADEVRAALEKLETQYKRSNSSLRRSIADGSSIGRALSDFQGTIRKYEEFKSKLVSEASMHEARAQMGKEPAMRLVSLH
jgi:hypothetical protein